MTVQVLTGDCRELLHALPSDSVHCVVTSPPYFGLRDYGVAGQIGLEDSLGGYLSTLVAVFAEVRRVLRKDGTCWCNIGDSYAGSRCGPQGNTGEMSERSIAAQRAIRRAQGSHEARPGAKPKDLLLVPARLALALQADGWWVRKDIIWSKPNPMPESAKDRPTSSHEHVFQLSKAERYFYDADAVREGVTGNAHSRGSGVNPKAAIHAVGAKQNASFSAAVRDVVSDRNLRDVWTIPSHPFTEAHFATFPPRLAELCISAGTSAHGCCARCGAPWRRIVEKGEPDRAHQRASGGDAAGAYHGRSTKGHAAAGVQDASAVKSRILAGMVTKTTSGWRASCRCKTAEIVPCTVLDPFGGAGTTGLVADRLCRDAILIELSPKYAAMARRRIARDAPLFTKVSGAGLQGTHPDMFAQAAEAAA